MRPVTLTLSGFRSYADEATIDFTGRNLFAIVGPIGAGKSSILDGIAYALYGQTPRFKRDQRSLICSRCAEAHVRFRFVADGSAYEITRTLRRKGAGEHVMVELDTGTKQVGAQAVSARVEELLGLSFSAFCSSILLAQGRFSEFLDAATDARTKILKGVFRFDQITALHQVAKARAADLGIELAAIEGELRGIPDDVVEQRTAAAAERTAAAARAAELAAAVPEEKDLIDQVPVVRGKLERAEDEERSAVKVLEALPHPDALEALVARRRDAEGALAAAETVRAAAVETAEARVRALAALEESGGSTADLAVARDKARRVGELIQERDDLAAGIEKRRGEMDEAAAALAAADAALAAAADAAAQARADIRRAERTHLAHAVAADLVAGRPCPVCEQVVEAVPDRAAPPDLDRARRSEAEAEAVLERARAVQRDAQVRTTKLEQVAASDGAALGRLVGEIARLGEEVGAVVGDAEDPAAEIERRLQALEAATAACKAATAARDAAVADVDRARTAAADATRDALEAARPVVAAAERAGTEVPRPDASPDELVRAADGARSALGEVVARARASVKAHRERVEELRGDLAALRARFELPAQTTVDAACATAHARVEQLDKDLAALDERIARAERLKASADAVGARRAVFTQLADDLTDKNFVNFLLEDRRRLLSELGSQRLKEMTQRYRFSDDARFDIVDELSGDQKRDVQTLSGGETFLASLALALGLAEAVTRQGGRLGCFFLDEGFGSLDAESLDNALDGIEKIVTRDRLIGLVSHLPALEVRVEDKIVLRKNADGTTEVVSGASL